MNNFLETMNKSVVAPVIASLTAMFGFYHLTIKNDLERTGLDISNKSAEQKSALEKKNFSNELRFRVFNEVKDAISKSENERNQEAARMMIGIMLDEDTVFRGKMIDLLMASPNTASNVKASVTDNERAITQLKAEGLPGASVKTPQTIAPINRGVFTIDVFYLEDVPDEAKAKASEVAKALKAEHPGFIIRQRLLPRSINEKPGYQVSANQIRFENSEKDLAYDVFNLLGKEKIFRPEQQPKLFQIDYSTPKYISIFVRNN